MKNLRKKTLKEQKPNTKRDGVFATFFLELVSFFIQRHNGMSRITGT